MSENNTSSKNNFFYKFAGVIFGIYILFELLLPDFSSLRKLDTPINRIAAQSFIQNPEALWLMADEHEKKDKLDAAIRDIRLAIGLLELHSSSKDVLTRYKSRLELLQAKRQAAK